MGRMRAFHCPECDYQSKLLADGSGMLSARALYQCAGCTDLVSLTVRLMGEDTTPDERELEHALGGCALPDLAEVNGDPVFCPCCGTELVVSQLGMWD